MPAGFQLTAQIQLRAPTNTGAIASSIQKQLSGITADVTVNVPRNGLSNVNSLNNQVKSLVKSTQSAKTAAFEFGESIGTAARKFTAFSVAAGTIVSFVGAIKEGISAALEFQHEMVRLNQIGGNVGNSIGSISKEISELSTSLGVSSAGLSKIATTLRQAGLSAEDTRIALQGIAETSLAPTFGDIENTVEGAIAAMQQFNLRASDLRGVLGSINRVSADFAVESDDIVHALRRSGGAFKAAGGNINELISLFTSVRQTTRESAETIASGFNTIFARAQRPQTVDQLKLMGINLRFTRQEAEAFGKVEGEFVGPYEAIRRLNDALSSVPPASAEYAAIVESLGGFRQVSKVIPLIQQFGTAQKVYGSAITGTQSLTQSSIKSQDSFIVKITQLKEEFLDLFRVLTGNKTLQRYAGIFLEIATSVTRAAKAIEPLVPLIATLGVAKGFQTIGRGFNSDFLKGARKGLATNTGGYRFAQGGVVPGVGNTDSVSATLMPGEFVIRKSAAQAIGYSNLHKYNRYAAGGSVKKDEEPDLSWIDKIEDEEERKKIKRQYLMANRLKKLPGGLPRAAMPHFATGGQLSPTDIRKERNIRIQNPEFNRLVISPPQGKVAMLVTGTRVGSRNYTQTLPVSSLRGDAKKRFEADKQSLLNSGGFSQELLDQIQAVTVPIAIRGPDAHKGQEVKNIIEGKILGTLNSLGNIFAEQTAGINISKRDSDTILKDVITTQGVGRIFEGFLKVVSAKINKGGITSEGSGARFDFDPIDKTGLSGLFPDVAGLTGDAKLNDNVASRASVVSKSIRKFGIDKNFSLNKLSKIYKIFQRKRIEDESGKVSYQKVIDKQTGEAKFRELSPIEFAKRQLQGKKYALGGRVRFATGGRADSTSIPINFIENAIEKARRYRDSLEKGPERDKATDRVILLVRAAEAARQNRATQLLQGRAGRPLSLNAPQSFLLHGEQNTSLSEADARKLVQTGSASGLSTDQAKKLAVAAQAPRNISSQLKKQEAFEQTPAPAATIRVPFRGDRGMAVIGKGTIGQAGPVVNFRSLSQVAEFSQNKTISDKLSKLGIQKVEASYTRHILSNEMTQDFSKTIYGPIAGAIKSAFLGKFGDFAKNINISKGTLDTLGGNLLEQYISGVSRTLLAPADAGKESIFDFPEGLNPSSSINKVLLPKLNPKDRVDIKSSVGAEKVTASLAGKYLAFNANKIDQQLSKKLASGKVKPTPKKLATGGGSGSDTVPALLTPGEFVFNREAARRIGYNNLEKMNRVHLGGRVKFATGGSVRKRDKTLEEFYNPAEVFAGQTDIDIDDIRKVSNRFGTFKRLDKTTRSIGSQVPENTIFGPQERAGIERRGDLSSPIGSEFSSRYLKNALDPQLKVLQGILSATKDSNKKLGTGGPGRGRGRSPNNITSPANEDTLDIKKGSRFSGAASLAAVIGAQYLPQISESLLGTVDKPGSLGVSGARAGSVVTGGVAGAAAGAATGSLFGPIGTGIGAAIGGLQGLVGALNETNEKILQIDFEKSMKRFDISIERATNTVGKLNSSNIADLAGGLSSITRGADRSSDRRSFLAQNVNSEQLGRVQQRLISDIELNSGDTRDTRIQKFYEAGNGLGRQLARIRLEAENLTFDELNREIDESVVRFAGEKQREKINIALAASIDKQTRNFEALARSTLAATNSIGALEGALSNIGTLSEGRAFVPDLPEFSGQLGGLDTKSFDRTVDFISNSFRGSGNELVEDFRNTAKGINEVSAILPNALKELLSRGVSEDNVGTALRDIITNSAAGVPEVLKQNLSEALSTFKLEDSLAKIRENANTFAEELEKKAWPNILTVLENVPKELRDRFQKLGQSIVQAQEINNRVRDARDKAGDISLQGARVNQSIFARRSGLTGTADRIPVGLAQQQFNRRQTELAGNIGLNPAAIGLELKRVRESIPRAEQSRNDAVVRGAGTNEATKAQLELSRLTSRAADLNKALDNLTNASERSAAIQERLGQINEQEAQRLSIAEEYLTANLQERAKIERSLVLARTAVSQGSVQGFNSEDTQQIFNVLKKLRDIRTPGLFGRTGEEASQFLLKNDPRTRGIANLPVDQEQERRGLEDELAKNFKDAGVAQQQLISSLEGDRDKFFNGLLGIHNTFFTNLNKFFLQSEQSRVQTRSLEANTNVNNVRKAQGAGNTLKSVGLGDFGVAKNVLSSPRVQSVVEGQKNIDKLRSFKDFDFSNILDEKATASLEDSIRRFNNKTINKQTLSNDVAVALQDKAPGSFKLEDLQKRIAGPAVNNAVNNPAGLRLSLADIRKALPTQINRAVTPDLNRELNAQKARVEEARHAIPAEVSNEGLNTIFADVDRFKKALEQVGTATNVDQLQKNFEAASVNAEGLSKELENLKTKIQGLGTNNDITSPANVKAVGRALGGSIFKSRGTDTVPAMLTPGEFVVNARAAQANKDILEDINKANGPIYRQAGGTIESKRAYNLKLLKLIKENPGKDIRTIIREDASRTANNSITGKSQLRGLIEENDARNRLGTPLGSVTLPNIPRDFSSRADKILSNFQSNKPIKGPESVFSSIENLNAYADNQNTNEQANLKTVALRERRRTIELRKQRQNRPSTIRTPNFTGRTGQAGFSSFNDLYRNRAFGIQPGVFGNQSQQSIISSANNKEQNISQPQLTAQQAIIGVTTGLSNIFRSEPGGLIELRQRYQETKNPSILKEIANLERRKTSQRARRFAEGGMAIGTDLIPAMLSPGEFIVNAQAAGNNMGILNNINKQGILYRQTGGPVGPAVDNTGRGSNILGGFSEAIDRLINPLNNFNDSIGNLGRISENFVQIIGPLNLFSQNIQVMIRPLDAFNASAANLSIGFGMFNRNAGSLTDALNNLSNLPRTITIEGRTQVNIVHTGLEALNTIRGNELEEIKRSIIEQVKTQITSDLKNGNVLG